MISKIYTCGLVKRKTRKKKKIECMWVVVFVLRLPFFFVEADIGFSGYLECIWDNEVFKGWVRY